MPLASKSPPNRFSRDGLRPIVKINGVIQKNAEVLQVRHCVGGDQVSTATFILREPLSGAKAAPAQKNAAAQLSNKRLDANLLDTVEIYIDPPNGKREVIHYGVACVQQFDQSLRLNRSPIESRTEEWMLGGGATGQTIAFNPGTQSMARVLMPLVFNPIIDGAPFPNRDWAHPITDPSGIGAVALGVGNAPSSIVSPESVRTTTARRYYFGNAQDAPKAWSLVEIVSFFLWQFNWRQAYFKNPGAAHLMGVLGNPLAAQGPPIRGLQVPHGLTFSQVMDRLLTPFGYGWFLDFARKQLRFFTRGDGRARTVNLQAERETFDHNKTNTPAIRLDCNVGSAATDVSVQLGNPVREFTLELSRAWPATLDASTESDMAMSSTAYQAAALAGTSLARTWRDWVLNESGDYTGTRPEIMDACGGHSVPNQLLNDADVTWSDFIPRRRRLLPTITQDGHGNPIGSTHGIAIQYSTDAGATWTDFDRLEYHGVEILDKEAGIRFAGELPPRELVRAGAIARVRVTAAIEMDRIATATAGIAQNAPLRHVQIDGSHRFRQRFVGSTSRYYAAVVAGTLESDACNDFTRAEDYAKELLKAWAKAECSGSVVIEGFDSGEYRLSDVLSAIKGRDIDLNCSLTNTPAYPQIVAISYEPATQRRTLSVQTFRDEVPLP